MSGRREECGIFGAAGVANAAEVTVLGLHALQHRGQESTGIVTCDGDGAFHAHKGLGLVADVYRGLDLGRLPGDLAVGHDRYSTAGRVTLENTQPLSIVYHGGALALAHNGNLVNARTLRARLEAAGSIFQTTLDSEVFLHLIARARSDGTGAALAAAAAEVRGAYALLLLAPGAVYAARDPHGFRPLCLGRLGAGHVVASETCALDLVGADYLRDVEPGELVRLDGRGVSSQRLVPPGGALHQCIFEHIYFSRPDSRVFGEDVDRVRRAIGRRLAVECPAAADVVIAVPDSSNSIALGYAEGSGLRYELGLIRNHYVGRTFILPGDRDLGVRIKFNPVRSALAGRRVVVVDDSIVRGTTLRRLVGRLREAGASEVHVRVGSPPIAHACYYGIDTPRRHDLIAAQRTVEGIRDFLGADSLDYLSLAGLLACEGRPEDFCRACFTGEYPLAIEPAAGKLAIEELHGPGAPVAADLDGPATPLP